MITKDKYLRSVRASLLAFIAVSLVCSDFGRISQPAAQVPVIRNIQTGEPERAGISNREMEEVCIAAISALSNRPPATVHLDGVETGLMQLSTRSTDTTPEQFTCTIEGKRVIWAPRGKALRDAASDERIVFRLSPDEIQLTITYPDGSEKLFSFPR